MAQDMVQAAANDPAVVLFEESERGRVGRGRFALVAFLILLMTGTMLFVEYQGAFVSGYVLRRTIDADFEAIRTRSDLSVTQVNRARKAAIELRGMSLQGRVLRKHYAPLIDAHYALRTGLLNDGRISIEEFEPFMDRVEEMILTIEQPELVF